MGKYEKSRVNGSRGVSCDNCGMHMSDGKKCYIAYTSGFMGTQKIYCSEGCAQQAGHVEKKGWF